MSELREDPLTGRRVLVAENRLARPNELASASPSPQISDQETAPQADCAFCPGNEALTPGAVHASLGDDGQWLVRVVPNKYPAITREAGPGAHEVVIESPHHLRRTGQLSADQLARVLLVYAERFAALAREERFAYRLVFKNVGASAGASLEHLHSQVIALPQVPPHAEQQYRLAEEFWSRTGRCGWCERVAAEREAGLRVVADTCEWLVFCPAAARQPFETWLMPADHQPAFESLLADSGAARRLAEVFLAVCQAVESQIEGAGYNVMIHTTATPTADADPWHWRIELLPRVASLAGFELASGMFMNVLSPERAAERLRSEIGA